MAIFMEYCTKQEALQELETIANKKQCFWVFQEETPYMRIIEWTDQDAMISLTEIPFSKFAHVYSKTEVGDIVDAFNIESVQLPSGKIARGEYFLSPTPPSYSDRLKMINHKQLKKDIFCFRRSTKVKFLKRILKQPLICLAKPVNMHPEPFIVQTDNMQLIVLFTDSDEVRAFLHDPEIPKDNIEDYYPLMLPFKLIKKNAHDADGYWFNPSCFAIGNKDFSMKIDNKTIKKAEAIVKKANL